MNPDERFRANSNNEDYDYPIFIAIREGHTEIAKLLVEYDADLSLRNKYDATPLIYAAKRHTETERGIFLTLGKNKNEPEKEQEKKVAGKLKLVELTLEQSEEDVTEEDYEYKKEVIGNLELIEMMIEKGADINAKDKYGCTALYESINLDSTRLMKLLIKKGADVNAESNGGFTVLMPAVWKAAHADDDIERKGYFEIIRYLVSKGADVNIPSKSNVPFGTILMTSVMAGDRETSELLIELGVDINAKDFMGHTVLDIAKEFKHEEIVELLIQKGAI